MKIPSNEVMIYFNPDTSVGKKTLAYAKSIESKVFDLDNRKNKLTTTLWRQVLELLDLSPKELLDKSHPYYQENIKGREFDDHGWLNILIHNPTLLKAPIAIKGNKAVLCTNPTDIYKLEAS